MSIKSAFEVMDETFQWDNGVARKNLYRSKYLFELKTRDAQTIIYRMMASLCHPVVDGRCAHHDVRFTRVFAKRTFFRITEGGFESIPPEILDNGHEVYDACHESDDPEPPRDLFDQTINEVCSHPEWDKRYGLTYFVRVDDHGEVRQEKSQRYTFRVVYILFKKAEAQ